MKRICTKIGFTLAVLASLYTMAATPGCEETLVASVMGTAMPTLPEG